MKLASSSSPPSLSKSHPTSFGRYPPQADAPADDAALPVFTPNQPTGSSVSTSSGIIPPSSDCHPPTLSEFSTIPFQSSTTTDFDGPKMNSPFGRALRWYAYSSAEDEFRSEFDSASQPGRAENLYNLTGLPRTVCVEIISNFEATSADAVLHMARRRAFQGFSSEVHGKATPPCDGIPPSAK